jgi:integrase/recombinase XerD
MPIYPHSKGKRRVRIWSHGRKQDWIIEGTKHEAQDFETRKRLELGREAPTEHRVAMTFSDYCLIHYSPAAASHLVAAGTWRNRKYQVATLVEFFGQTRLDRFDAAIVGRFRDMRRAEKMSPSTINDDVKVLFTILNHAKASKLCPVVVPELKRLKEPKKRGLAQAWSDEEMARLLAAAAEESPAILPMLVFLANTGARKTEAVELMWRSVHFKTGQIAIEPNEEWRPKDNEARLVPMNEVLRSWLDQIRTENERRKTPSPYVFTGERFGERWAMFPQRPFDRARNTAVPPDIRELHAKKHGAGAIADCRKCRGHALQGGPNKLRHSYASHYLANGGDLYSLSQIMGHSHSRVTKLYSHMLPGALEKAAERVSFAPATGPAVNATKRAWRADA